MHNIVKCFIENYRQIYASNKLNFRRAPKIKPCAKKRSAAKAFSRKIILPYHLTDLKLRSII